MSSNTTILDLVKSLPRRVINRYRRLPLYGKAIVWLWILFEILLVIALIIITPKRVGQFLYDNAEKLARLRFGWLIVATVVVLTSFPPFHGHTTVTTLCGFAWGLKGFYIAAPASLIGSTLVFVTLRASFKERLRSFSKSNEKWSALEAVIAAKGLPLIILIRMSPLPPYVYSNVMFSSISSVALWQFVVATCFVFPKIFLQVFIGSRIAALSDGEQRDKMDPHTKMLNGALIGGGIFIAISASWLVYRLVTNHIRTLPGVPPEVDEQAAEAIEGSETAPLLGADSV
ncbi:unnamed protein product [Mycena citricolor]|uniref:Golgi apparatus membrane protein TVP38 n=1 Tax=Mycena citricolor TaxID=2018698 RepID=A0AAD2GRS2_9AGAR|nr:unnamed protein product [Mycena citricolor]CAK5275687.1 unnamed protein product [Mycena citricolor]